MNTTPQNFAVRSPRASYVIVQRVPQHLAETYLQWERGISAAAALFPGYQLTEAYPPTDPANLDWVIVIHFDDPKSLDNWLNSPQRAKWMADLPPEFRRYRLKAFPSGLGDYFALFLNHQPPLPHLKAIFAVLLALYPTIMLMTFYLTPHLNHLGAGLSMLVGNIISVAFLEYLGMPAVSRLLGPWLHANSPHKRTLSIAGFILITAALAFMTWIFHLLAHHFPSAS